MAALWLAAFLTPACCLLPTDPDPGWPIQNLRVDPQRKILTWDLNGNASDITCSVNGKPETQARSNQSCGLDFEVAVSRCDTFNLTVTVKKPRWFSASIQRPPPAKNPGTRPVGLDCWVHDASVLTCSWGAGPEAPPDAQYRLFWEDLGPTAQAERECARYQADARGFRCRFDNITWASDKLQRFLVNGSARGSPVACSEVFGALTDIERLSPPKLTGWCNSSHAVLLWQPPSRLQKVVTYELWLQKGTAPPETRTMDQTSAVVLNPGDFVVRIRAHSLIPRVTQSAWSAPQHFGCSGSAAWVSAALVLGTLLAVGVPLLLCWRYSVPQKLFPPIPAVKDPLRGLLHSNAMATTPSEDCPVAQLQVVGET